MKDVATYARPAVVEFEAALTALLQGDGGERGENPAVVERSGRHGEMTPLHVHSQDEVVYLVEGALTAFVGKAPFRLGAGHAIVAPRAIPHTFLVESREARYLSATLTLSATRYASRVAALAAPNGIEVLGPPGEIGGS
jgi:quercetin dioxygenase-like cupin family protein